MDRLTIERIGGFAGFGGSRLKSRGEVSLSDLAPADRDAVERLLADLPGSAAAQGGAAPRTGAADAFSYRLTVQSPDGPKTVEAPEHLVPSAVRDSVRDTLD
ncbi:MAG: hypothetical protein JO048_06565 [Methylobacteriaceae bacterium]|nr:hypothetical protein [Methylobacteriaceae bacterium]